MPEINKIYNQSCIDGLKNIPDESVDLIFTDPPYFQYRAQNVQGLKNHKDVETEFEFDSFGNEEEYLNFLEEVLTECFRVAKPGAAGYIWCGDDFVSYINRMVDRVGFKFRKVIHWHKTNPFPAIYTRKMFANSMELLVHFSKGTPKTWNHKHVNEMHNFIQAPICMGKERTKHKTQKPLKVCIPYIEISSNPGELVLDPFIGSGSTAVAAKMLGRNFIGFE
ncbi:MAG TPA: site-specific DNA-methyltransferase, partial [Paludibacter sp.]|nr:site-specific DNA-methyltransferase [Paludibacter sp.]